MAVGPDNNLYSPNPERRTVTAADGTELRLATVNGTTALVPANADPAGVTPYTAPADAPEANGLFATDTEPVTPAQYLAGGVAAAAGQPLSYDERVSTVLFIMLEPLPLVAITASIATLCIVLFFVTSSDSASMVIDIIATGGNPDPPVGTRLFWAISEGVVAAVLLLAGGLQALQTASITAALPFTFVLILMCVSLFRALSADEMTRFQRNRQRAVSAAERAAERTAEEYLEENLDTTARAGT
jgi:choline/glycine/proline betaine transport protein